MPHRIQPERLAMSRKLTCTTAISLVFLATGAVADVTPEEVWESWQALVTAGGQELTVGGAVRNGDTLEVTGVLVTYKDGLGGGFSAALDNLSFKDNGDGTVGITMADSYPMEMTFPPEVDGPASLKLLVTQPGMTITASGSAEETGYDYVAPTIAASLTEMKDETGAVIDVQADLVMTEVTSTYRVSREGEAIDFDYSFAAKTLALNVTGKEAAGPGAGTGTLAMTELAGTSTGNILGADTMANMAAALNSGFTTDGTLSFATMAANFDIDDGRGPVKGTAASQAGGVTFGVSKDRVNYGTSLMGLAMTMSGPDLPFPEVSINLSEYAVNVLMPVSKSEVPQDFAFLAKLVDFTISEDVWGLVDPGAVLSREPASFVLDIKGQGFWNQDILDPTVSIEQIDMPGELTSLEITQVLAKAAGTEVSATGALEIDNSDLVTFQGVPAPTGTIEFGIKGVNALIDNLIKLGFITDDDALGARMMLGMFTRPGAGPDEVTSILEFKDKDFLVNGMPMMEMLQ
jgi:hypothetical protein